MTSLNCLFHLPDYHCYVNYCRLLHLESHTSCSINLMFHTTKQAKTSRRIPWPHNYECVYSVNRWIRQYDCVKCNHYFLSNGQDDFMLNITLYWVNICHHASIGLHNTFICFFKCLKIINAIFLHHNKKWSIPWVFIFIIFNHHLLVQICIVSKCKSLKHL